MNNQKIREILMLIISMLINKTMYRAALDSLGLDASPSDLVPDELGCAESVSNIIRKIYPTFPIVTGTWTLWDVLRRHPNFKVTTKPEPGNIVISPTGTSRKRAPFVGHVGIVGERDVIMSNDSNTGKFMANYSIETWRARWETKGSYPVYYFKLV